MIAHASTHHSPRRRLPWALAALAILALGALPLTAADLSTVAPPPGAVPESLTGSYVAFDPTVGGDLCYLPGVAGTFCFIAYSYSPDWEYAYNVWERFPADWIVTNVYVQGTPTCTNGGTFGTFGWTFETSPYEVNISHTRYHSSGGDACTAYYCVEAVAGTGTPDALVSWFWDGDSYSNPPHWPCSSDGYAPAGFTCDEAIEPPAAIPPCVLPPVMLTPASIEAEGCPGVPQIHTFTAWNNAGYNMNVTMSYAIVAGTGSCSGPATVPVANGASVPFNVEITPTGAFGDTTVCEIEAVDPGNPANHDESLLTKHLVPYVWDPAGWQNQTVSGALPAQWASCAAGWHPSAPGLVGYQVGGLVSTSSAQALLQMYDPGAGAWTQLPLSPQALFGHVASFIDSKLYVSGGFDGAFTGSANLQVFNPATNSWNDTSYPDIPAAGGRGGGAGGVGICHTGSGLCHFHVGGGPDGSFANSTLETWEFNPATNAWTQLDSRPGGSSPDGFLLGAGVGCLGYIFVGGDYRGYHDFFGIDPTWPAGSQWLQLASIPDAAGAMTPAMVCSEPEGAIYLIGGDPDGYWGNYNTTVYRYAIFDDMWSGPLPYELNVAVTGSCGVGMADRLWTFGGTIGSGPIVPVPHESLQWIACPAGLPFADGFESGNTSAWSATVP